MMDRRTLIAFGLIAVVFVLWSVVFAPKPPEQAQKGAPDTTARPTPAQKPSAPQPVAAPTDPRFKRHTEGASRFIVIETPLYKATINTRGALLARMELKQYRSWYGAPVQLICDSVGFPGVLALGFTGPDGRPVSTESMVYSIDGPDKLTLGEKDSAVLTARLVFADSGIAKPATIEKRFVFRGNQYGVGFDVAMRDMAGVIAPTNPSYEISWRNGVKYQEHNSVEESGKTKTLVVMSEDEHTVDHHDVSAATAEKFQGTLVWMGTHVKYFGAALIPQTPIAKSTAQISASAVNADSAGMVEVYSMTLSAPIAGDAVAQPFTLFAGPLEYDAVHEIGIGDLLDLGVAIIRPISEYVLLPLFRSLHSLIGNYGLVIIVFSVVIRLALWPLSIPQIKSSRKMQLLQPKIQELREKFKDDQQRQQMESMKIYREYGINPMGGCLPMLLQLPILYALWSTLSSAIDLRQTSFMFWITDLSVPDYIVQLPFHVPLLGDKLSALALVMGATLFIQQKMMITDPKQKMLVYIMPLFLTLAFNNLPSGLNLYYFTFNLLAIGQQVYMTKFSKNPLTLEQMKAEAKNKKKGWLSTKLEEAQKMAEAQQRASQAGRDKKVDGRTPVEPRKKG